MTTPPPPAILALVFDLFFVSRIESVAKRLGVPVHFWEEPTGPPEPAVLEKWLYNTGLSPGNPALKTILIDLSAPGFPWEAWIRALAAYPQTAAVPIITFGSHVNVAALQAARQAGAAEALAKSAFTADLPEILEKYLA